MRRVFAAMVVLGALIAPFAVAGAATTKKSHKAKLAMTLVQLGPAASDGTLTFVGTTTGGPFGKGLVRIDSKLVSGVFESTFEVFTRDGSVRGQATDTVTGRPDGGIDHKGDATVAGGTGSYKGATSGKLAMTGTQAPNETTFVLNLTGRIKY
jgi:hypothetical protein